MAAKYTADELKALGAKGQAFKNPDGSFSYPIADADDLDLAIHAVGRGNADHDALRKYIAGRAKALGLSSKIPDNWNADGSLTDAKSAPTAQDADVTSAITAAQQALSQALAAQGKDPDNGSDPDDAAVLAHLEAAHSALAAATVAQAADNAPDDKESKSRVPVVIKKGAFPSVREHEVPVTANIQIRAADGESVSTFDGYASMTATPYDVTDWLGSYRETIQPGSFAKTLRETENVPLLINHDGIPIASTQADTSRLSEDSNGLHNEASLDRRQGLTNDICIALERGDLSKMSFSFKAVKQDWSADYADRSVSEVRLYDTSIVTYPASPTTSAGLRSELVDAIGREGRSVMHSLLAAVEAEQRSGDVVSDIEKALLVLRTADDFMTSRDEYRFAGRARTMLLANVLTEAREGKVLSKASKSLLTKGLAALSEAQGHLSALQDTDDGTVNDDGSVPRSAEPSGRMAFREAQALLSSIHRP